MAEITAENYREFANKNIYRIIDSFGGRKTIQKYDGYYGYPVWRTLLGGPIDCPALAEDILAVFEGRITQDEQTKRERARDRAKKKAARSIPLPSADHRSV